MVETVSRPFYTVGDFAVRRVTSGPQRGLVVVTRVSDPEVLEMFGGVEASYAAKNTAHRFDSGAEVAPKTKAERMADLESVSTESLVAMRDVYAVKEWMSMREECMVRDIRDALALRG